MCNVTSADEWPSLGDVRAQQVGNASDATKIISKERHVSVEKLHGDEKAKQSVMET